MTENEFIKLDRINAIRDTINKYGIDNFYLSFSGGKDSTILHYLLDLALPDNNIPRVFINTGIEYNDIVDFVKELAKHDSRFIIIKSNKSVKSILEEKGYPFKSKEHSCKLYEFQIGHRNTKSINNYLHKESFGCPEILKYQFSDDFKLKVSDKCCKELKKKTIRQYEKQSKKTIAITGMRKAEGGQRTNLNCIVVKDGKIKKFHPLVKVSNEWEEWFINYYKIKLCKLYYPPYNFKRTGCKGCPFSLDLQEQLDTMAMYMPIERKQCEIIWQPVYNEYRRLNYRLKDKITIFD